MTEAVELSVLGAMLCDSTRTEAVFSAPEGLFLSDPGKCLFRGIRSLYGQGFALTPEALAIQLEIDQGVSHEDATGWVAEAVVAKASPENFKFMLASLSSSRVTSMVESLAGDLTKNGKRMKLDEVLSKLTGFQRELGLLDLQRAETYEKAMRDLAKQGRVKYFVPGMGPLDKVLQIDEGTVCYVGGRSAGGKTSWMLNALLNMATAGHRVGIIEIEMRRNPLASRLSGMLANLDTRKIMKGEIEAMEREHLEHVVNVKQEIISRVKGIEPSSFHADMMKPTLERWRDEWGCEIVGLDYVQICTGKGADRTREVQYISRAITAAAKDTNIPVIGLSQARRSEGDVKMQDFKESAQLEHDSDVMVTLNAADGYMPGDKQRKIWCEIVKNRNNFTTKDLLLYDLPTQVFTHTGEFAKQQPTTTQQSKPLF